MEGDNEEHKPRLSRRQAIGSSTLTLLATALLFLAGGLSFWGFARTSADDDSSNTMSQKDQEAIRSLRFCLSAALCSQALSCVLLTLPLLRDAFTPRVGGATHGSTAVTTTRAGSVQMCRAAGVSLSLTGLAILLVSLSAPSFREILALVAGALLFTLASIGIMITFWPAANIDLVVRGARPTSSGRRPGVQLRDDHSSSSSAVSDNGDEANEERAPLVVSADGTQEDQATDAYQLMQDNDAEDPLAAAAPTSPTTTASTGSSTEPSLQQQQQQPASISRGRQRRRQRGVDETHDGAAAALAVRTSSSSLADADNNNEDRIRGARRLFQVAVPQMLYLYAGFAVLLVRLPFSLAIPHFVSTTLAALAQADFVRARHEIILLFILGSIDAACDFWCVFLFGYANIRIVRSLRLQLFGRLLRQEVAFFDDTPSGELASRLNSDTAEMGQDLTWFFRMCIESVVRIVGITAYMLIRSPVLGAFTLTIVPVVGAINKFYGDWLGRNARQVQDALAQANSVAQEALANVRVVIAFAAERRECQRYQDRIERQFQLNLRQLFMQGIYYMVVSTFLINTLTQALLLWIGTRLIERERLTAEVMLAFMLYQGHLQHETLNIFMCYSSFIKCCGAGDKVFALLDRQPPEPSTAALLQQGTQQDDGGEDENQGESGGEGTAGTGSAQARAERRGGADQYDVELKGVTFRYPTRPDQPVLNNLDLMIPKGTTLALCGASGCGKTTIVNLLQRFYDPLEGSILIDGTDLRTMDLTRHRRHIGVVTQDPALFRGTILENITYGIPDSRETPLREVRRVARLANADEFIRRFEEQYETQVGESGIQLSGGQKQRVSIARAIIKSPALLLLDEATSSLDTASEKIVQDALDKLLDENRDMTTVIVAHRLNTVRNADRIAFIQDGRVVELGTHEELVQLPNGLYRQMVERSDEATGVLAGS